MIHFDLPKQKSSIIKVIGVGGGGSNAVNYMFSQTVEGVDFIVCNTDAKALEQSNVPNKIQLGPYLTQGLGAGANPEVGKKATEESLDEIRKILEVNTKMAFITVGMGGGTGTGGAPIIAQVCKELGILTVGIVTTPFSFEGPRRLAMAEEGINQLKPHVDTLLVISNDKLRMQFGNLKMREAFGKADNVLATAAKCITDVINSRGHIMVDFADVCTVMKNGGVAILGKAEAEGENRAQDAIEEALASPLLNDNDIRGAKWVLINIHCAEGDDECTMDEIETINNFLRMQAGENTDVIVGTGYDNTLGRKIGITLIATGFDSKNPFAKPVVAKAPIEEPIKIMMTLDLQKDATTAVQPVAEVKPTPAPIAELDPYAPTLQTDFIDTNPFSSDYYSSTNQVEEALQNTSLTEESDAPLYFELSTKITQALEELDKIQEEKKVVAQEAINESLQFVFTENPTSNSQVNNSMPTKPTNIYTEFKPTTAYPPVETVTQQPTNFSNNEVTNSFRYTQPEKEVEPVAPPVAESTYVAETVQPVAVVETSAIDEMEEQKKKAQDRLNKLRNLSFNKDAEGNDDFETVPAYIRKKMELFGNAFTSAESFYSKYTVDKEENKTVFSAINTFLDGKKPD